MRKGIVSILLGLVLVLSGCGNSGSSPAVTSKPAEPPATVKTAENTTQQPKAAVQDTTTKPEVASQTKEAADSKANGDDGEKTSKEEDVLDILTTQVPEIKTFSDNIDRYNKDNPGTHSELIMRIDAKPDPASSDPNLKKFYEVYVGESMQDHTNRMATFLVREDLKEIRVEDPVTGEYISLREWQKKNSEQ